MIRKFFKDAGFVSGSEVLLKLKGLIIIPLLTYHFGAVNYGVWSQVLILIAIIAPFVMLSTDSGFMRHAMIFAGRKQLDVDEVIEQVVNFVEHGFGDERSH